MYQKTTVTTEQANAGVAYRLLPPKTHARESMRKAIATTAPMIANHK